MDFDSNAVSRISAQLRCRAFCYRRLDANLATARTFALKILPWRPRFLFLSNLERKLNTSIPPTEYDRFRLSCKELQFEKSDEQYVSLTRSEKFLESSGIRSSLGASLARNLLNIETPTRDKAKATKVLDTIPTELDK